MVEFEVKISEYEFKVNIYNALVRTINEINKSSMIESDKILMLNTYLSGIDLGVFLGSNNNISIDRLTIIKIIKDMISDYDNKKKSATDTWKNIDVYIAYVGVE